MKNFGRVLLAIVVLAGGGIVFSRWQSSNKPEGQPVVVSPSPTASQVVQAESPPPIRYPVPIEEKQSHGASEKIARKSLPALDESDQTVEDALIEIFGKERLVALFNLKDILRRVVVTVDNSTGRKQPAQEFSPLKELDSPFRVTGKGEELSIAPANFRRYAPYVALIHDVDARKLFAVYVHFYPLFQSAFADLGKAGYFNDRMVQVIDSVLATPDVKGSIRLTRPTRHSRYKYADDQLEMLSAGQKILIRMGSENAHLVREKLREIRSLLITSGLERRGSQ
jgi:hypothetical protein